MRTGAAPRSSAERPPTVSDVPPAREHPDPTWVTLGTDARSGDDDAPPLRAWRVFGQLVAATAVVLVVVTLLGLAASKRIAARVTSL